MTLWLNTIGPGNIRELENVIQSAIIMCDDGIISPEISLKPCGSLMSGSRAIFCPVTHSKNEYRITKSAGATAIQDCNGNKTHAARSLQISRTYLHRLIRDPMDESRQLSSVGAKLIRTL